MDGFDFKVALLLAASPGRLVGICGRVTARVILSNIKAMVLPDQLAIPQAGQAFGENGDLLNEHHFGMVHQMATKLVDTITRLPS